MRKQIDYAAVCFSAIFVILCFFCVATAVKWTLAAFGIEVSGLWLKLIVVLVWCVVIGFIMWCGMRKAKYVNGKKG